MTKTANFMIVWSDDEIYRATIDYRWYKHIQSVGMLHCDKTDRIVTDLLTHMEKNDFEGIIPAYYGLCVVHIPSKTICSMLPEASLNRMHIIDIEVAKCEDDCSDTHRLQRISDMFLDHRITRWRVSMIDPYVPINASFDTEKEVNAFIDDQIQRHNRYIEAWAKGERPRMFQNYEVDLSPFTLNEYDWSTRKDRLRMVHDLHDIGFDLSDEEKQKWEFEEPPYMFS